MKKYGPSQIDGSKLSNQHLIGLCRFAEDYVFPKIHFPGIYRESLANILLGQIRIQAGSSVLETIKVEDWEPNKKKEDSA